MIIQKGFLSVTQSRFTSGLSTETDLLNATNRWILNINRKQFNLTLFLHLRKAFDAVALEILINCNRTGGEMPYPSCFLSDQLKQLN